MPPPIGASVLPPSNQDGHVDDDRDHEGHEDHDEGDDNGGDGVGGDQQSEMRDF